MMTDRPSTRASRSGFTLLELTIAIAVFSVGMLSINAVLISAMKGGSRGRHTTHASAIAEAQMERLQRASWTQLAPTAGWSAPVVVHNQVQGDGGTSTEQSYSVDWRITDLVAGWTRVVDVRVQWDEPGRPGRSVVFETIRYNRSGV
jgi:prepilin-type N-terminal cleavage/methylation domain-containing protein